MPLDKWCFSTNCLILNNSIHNASRSTKLYFWNTAGKRTMLCNDDNMVSQLCQCSCILVCGRIIACLLFVGTRLVEHLYTLCSRLFVHVCIHRFSDRSDFLYERVDLDTLTVETKRGPSMQFVDVCRSSYVLLVTDNLDCVYTYLQNVFLHCDCKSIIKHWYKCFFCNLHVGTMSDFKCEI